MTKISERIQPMHALSTPGTAANAVVVKRGETMEGIAAKHGASIQDLMKLNPQIKDPGEIKPGQEIRVPPHAKEPGMGKGAGADLEFERCQGNVFSAHSNESQRSEEEKASDAGGRPDTAMAKDVKGATEQSESFNAQYLALQQCMQNENRQYAAPSNIVKTSHDTAKNSINNIR